MNIWAFLFYGWITFGFGRASHELQEKSEHAANLILISIWAIVTFLFIYMGWCQ